MPQQTPLFGAPPRREAFDLPDAEIWLERAFLPPAEARAAMAELAEALPWRQEEIRLYGKVHPVPRLSCWLGEEGATYAYSGILHHPVPWGPVAPLLRRIEQATGARFNSALANLYRSGADTVGWHADDEPELGPRPRIASLSLGAPRRFVLRHRETRQKVEIELPPGSLLWMGGETQRWWEHTLPRTRRAVGARINLTFRWVGGR
jgi:alkylated DNA repair dioxygenase AlkB